MRKWQDNVFWEIVYLNFFDYRASGTDDIQPVKRHIIDSFFRH